MEAFAAAGRMAPLGEVLVPGEIADLVAWLASDGARNVTGQSIVIVEEARAAADLARRELARTEAAVADAAERGNRAQITRAENLRDVAFDVARMTEVYWRKREAWLIASEEALGTLRPRELLGAVIHAREMPT